MLEERTREHFCGIFTVEQANRVERRLAGLLCGTVALTKVAYGFSSNRVRVSVSGSVGNVAQVQEAQMYFWGYADCLAECGPATVE